MKTAGLLLAAGRSRRFGARDKLVARFRGAPLVSHAAAALRNAAFQPLIAVVSANEVADLLPGFALVRPPPGAAAQSRSLAAGVAEAEARGADRLLVALGDMPGVTPALLREIAERCPPGGASAAYDGARAMPPACFDRALFGDLRTLTGDRGAAAILRTLPREALVAAPPRCLDDIDTPEALAQGPRAAPDGPGDG